jgi:hypothetical protein
MNIVYSPWPPFAFASLRFFFLDRINRMATDVGPLEPGLDEHVIRSGIRNKGKRKTLAIFFFSALTSPLYNV